MTKRINLRFIQSLKILSMSKWNAETVQLNIFDFLVVKQQNFEGPLDLLLELISQRKMSVHDIALKDICKPYLEYLEHMENFNMEVAVEFLHIASSLILIKSKSLLPFQDEDSLEEDPFDTEEQLKQKLIDYQRYKQIAAFMKNFDLLGRDTFTRPFKLEEIESEEETGSLEDLDIYSLIKAYHALMVRQSYDKPHQVSAEILSLEERLLEIISLLKNGSKLVYKDLVGGKPQKMDWILTFLSILELTRFYVIRLLQAEEFGGLYIMPADGQELQIKLLEEQYFEIISSRNKELFT
ncbi:MAG: segregation/condensation protein A [Deltaproteobacteria bacterium]|nr:segregation/condensation protein A [Deltaproteobacteria bacterium]